MAHKEVKTMTVSEAIALGYTYCLQDGADTVDEVDEVDQEELIDNTYWLCAKTPNTPTISPEELRDIIMEHIACQEEFNSDLGDLIEDGMKAIDISQFQPLSDLIAHELSVVRWWPTVGIQLLPDNQ